MVNDPETDEAVRDLIGIWNWQVSSNLVIACERVCEYINVPVELGRHGMSPERFIAAIHPDDRAALDEVVKMAIEAGDSMVVEYRLRSTLHGTRRVRSQGRCFRTPAGRLTHISGYLTDIERSQPSKLEHEGQEPERTLVDLLTKARELAASLDYGMVGALIDATLLETGFQIAARLLEEES
ncbi:PAS domain-containing protein [Aureimonas sp. AU20]|uniref:PAS domain-containing protein n=1 Tax=Aureimonas sp. AU20 TaxID=1349819 RepID=UPI000721DC3C|nr:PAS domain-containing protein [Aureimonas sp. AU20]ALN75161.1 hypothetical protein M673_20730 [Aureimonas sp. AU20]